MASTRNPRERLFSMALTTAHRILLVVILLTVAGTASAFTFRADTDQGPVTIRSHYRSLTQGEALLIRLSSPAFSSAVARLDGAVYSFTPLGRDGDYGVLLPLDLDMEPCDYHLEIFLSFPGGSKLRAPLKLSLAAGAFPSTTLSVDPRFTSPSPEELERIREERALLDELYTRGAAEWLGKGNFCRPLAGSVSSPFGVRRIFNETVYSRHRGVDLRSPPGTPVLAANTGSVLFARSLFYGGNTVIIDHGMDLFTLYCHLSDITVLEGEFVDKGIPVGTVGATGRVTGPHLHWGARIAGITVDPLSLLHLPFEQTFQILAE